MKFLLDTPALLWWLADEDRFGPQALGLIEDPGNDVMVSVVSLWEIVVKVRVGKLEASIKDIMNAVERDGFTLLGITGAHLVGLADLPMLHREPFDHLLIAQAISEQAIFVSEDQNTSKYPVEHLTCRD